MACKTEHSLNAAAHHRANPHLLAFSETTPMRVAEAGGSSWSRRGPRRVKEALRASDKQLSE